MNEQAIRFRFGIFVLAALILLAVLVILFGGFPNYFRRTESFTIEFGNAQGITPGTPVKRSGVRIGEVRSLALNNDTGKVKVVIQVDEKYTLRKGDRATLVQGLLGGDSAIAFLPPEDPKMNDPTPVEPGSVLQGVTPADAGQLMQKTADLVQPAQEAVIEMRKLFVSINKMTPVVEETLKNFSEIGKMAKNVGPDLQKTSDEIRKLAKSTNDMVPEIGATARVWGKVGERTDVMLRLNEEKINRSIDRMDDSLKRINNVLSDQNQKYIEDTLRNVKNGSTQLDSIAKETSELIKESRTTIRQMNETFKRADVAMTDLQRAMKPLGDRGPAIFKNVEESTDSLNKTMKDLRELMNVVARSEGTVSKLIFDPALYNNLNSSAEMVTKILPRLDRTLRDMETFADKLARHPELLGLRGAIVPSIGLKESPSVIPYHVLP